MTTAGISQHGQILGALVVREMTTRFGRQGLGFAWLIAEPMIFCLGVLLLWSLTKPAYEHGVRLAPFVMTGYMCLILIRHLIGLLSAAIPANIGLLYHRHVSPLHLLAARALLEIGGATIAFIAVYVLLFAIGQVSLPHSLLLVYGGWFLFAWSAMGLALVLTGFVMRFEAFERVVGLISYLMIPVSGAFFMVSWLPEEFRKFVLMLPFVHGVEMVRSGVFGEFVKTYYDFAYALAIGTILNVVGLLLIAGSINRLEVE